MEEIRSLDAMLNDEELMSNLDSHSAEHDALMQDPELRRHVADTVKKHWERWVDMELLALGGRTPREAVKDSDGREAVEALLVDAERLGDNDPDMGEMNRNGTQLVRKILGLTRAPVKRR